MSILFWFGDKNC